MSNANRMDFLTPVGRLVSGSPFEAQTTDSEGNALVIKSGPNAGQPTQRYFMALAIPKTDVSFNELYAKMQTVAKQAFPRLFDQGGNCILPTFAWKCEDGDSQVPNMKGTRNCDREGYPGNWILKFQSSFQPKCYTTGGASVITDPEAIKRGYFIRIYGNIVDNASQQKPGIILNPNMVEFVAYGEVLSSGPDGAAVFGGAPIPTTLPAGATMTPPAPSATLAPVVAPAPVATPAPVAPVVTPAPVAPVATPAPIAPVATPAPVAPVATPAPVAPAHDFLNPAPPAVKEEFYEVSGAKYTRPQLLGFGWTNEQVDALTALPF